MVANLLAADLKAELVRGECTITVVGDSPEHCFQPGNLDVAFKGAKPGRFLHPEKPLLNKRVEFLAMGAQKIRAQDALIVLGNGQTLAYDHLVLATGAEARQDLIPGLKQHTHSFHLGPAVAQRLWNDLQTFRGGRIVVAIAEFPYKCPPSPNEACFLLDEWLRKEGLRDATEIKLLTPYPRAYPAAKISEQVEARFKKLGIALEPFFNLGEVDGAKKVLRSLEGDEVPYDVAIVIPPHRGAHVIVESGLGDKDGWIPTDKQTLRVQGHANLYALGDCTNIPISKSGVVAHLQSVVVAKNILGDLGKRLGEWAYNGRINCPMEIGDHRLLFVSATYEEPPEQDNPTIVKYAMKKAFNRMYWSALSGKLEWMFDLYFGPTATHRLPTVPGDAADAKEDAPMR